MRFKILYVGGITAVVMPFFLFAQAPSIADLERELAKARAEYAVRMERLEKLEARVMAAEMAGQYVKEDPKSATIKIRVQDPRGSVTGSAFILECAKDLNDDGTRNCLVATVAHAFRNAGITNPRANLKATPIQVQFSEDGKITDASAPGTFVGGNLQGDIDVAYVIIKAPGDMVVPIVPIVPLDYRAARNQPVVQFGYPNGTSVAQVNRRTIVNTTASRYIACSGLSASGNSGGLLINTNGQAIGIASASDQQGGSECQFTSFRDMYALAADPAIARELARNGLGVIFKK